jgi:hypothetical protein
MYSLSKAVVVCNFQFNGLIITISSNAGQVHMIELHVLDIVKVEVVFFHN